MGPGRESLINLMPAYQMNPDQIGPNRPQYG